jgi:hypothetical protein
MLAIGWLIFIFAFIIGLTFNLYVALFNNFSSSDHFTHKLFIDLIRKNNNRFIMKRGNILNENIMSYPQLIHWFIAVFGDRVGRVIERYLQLVVFICYASIVLLVTLLIQKSSLDISPIAIGCSGALTILAPYAYSPDNAKNLGLSTRGVGLVLVVLIFCISIFNENEIIHPLWEIGIFSIINLLILLTNRFAFQFTLFSSFFFAIFFQEFYYGAGVLIGTLLFIVLFRKFAINYFVGQFQHKKVYSKYLAPVFIFKARKSIWLDFIQEIPKRLNWYLRGNPFKDFTELKYIASNPVLLVIFKMPAIILSLVFFLTIPEPSGIFVSLFSIVLIGLVLFVLTSFRISRFLGEPERYLEFALPFSSVLLFLIAPLWLSLSVLIYSAIVTVNSMLLFRSIFRKKSSELDTSKLRDYLINEVEEENRTIFCLHTQDKKHLRSVDIKMFDFLLSNDSSDGFHVKDIFPDSYSITNINLIDEIVEKYEINYLVLRTEFVNEVEKCSKLKKFLVFETESTQLYKIIRQ